MILTYFINFINYNQFLSTSQEAVPHWGDRHDILALLRACNYDPDECISIYLHLQKDGEHPKILNLILLFLVCVNNTSISQA